MQRRLVLMRHAKSSWRDGTLSDHVRPLNGRGRKDAPRMGQELAARGWVPGLVASSDSARTRETWDRMRTPLGAPDLEVLWSNELYLADLSDLRAHAAGWDDAISSALALGHNPGWSDAASILAGRPISMTTANCALLVGHGASWIEALGGPWELVALLRPRELPLID